MNTEIYNPKTRQYTFDFIYKLLDKYYLYGFLYDEKGRIKMEYHHPYNEPLEDGSDGPLKDSDGCEMMGEKFLIDEFTYPDNKYLMLNPYLDVHCNVHFDKFDWKEIESLSNDKIKERFIGDDMKQLIAMLRRGYNYAMPDPVDKSLSDSYLEDMICFVWKMMVISTMNIHDVKKKYFVPGNDYYKEDSDEGYKWDERHHYSRIKDDEDYVSVIPAKIDFSYIFTDEYREKQKAKQEKIAQEEAEMMRIISISMTQQEHDNDPMNNIIKAINGEPQNAYTVTESEDGSIQLKKKRRPFFL